MMKRKGKLDAISIAALLLIVALILWFLKMLFIKR